MAPFKAFRVGLPIIRLYVHGVFLTRKLSMIGDSFGASTMIKRSSTDLSRKKVSQVYPNRGTLTRLHASLSKPIAS